MNGNCHFVYGAAVGTTVVVNLDMVSSVLPQITNTPETATLFILGGLLGGIFPDIDNPSSHMGKLAAPLSTIIGAVGRLHGKVGSNHRGILHDPTVYIIGLLLSYMYIPSLTGFFVGCLSHLFLDMFNPKGIPFLMFHRLHLGNFKSGDTGSKIFTAFITILTLAVGIAIHYYV